MVTLTSDSSSHYCSTVKETLVSSTAIHMIKSSGSLNDWYAFECIVYSMEREVGADETCWKQHAGDKLTYNMFYVTSQEGLNFIHIVEIVWHRRVLQRLLQTFGVCP